MKITETTYIPTEQRTVNNITENYTGKSFLEVCEDIATENAAGIHAVTEENEYAGMSDVEIYLAIEEKYKNLYGEDFLEKHISNIKPDSFDEANKVALYYTELRKYLGGNDESVKTVARNTLYGDMTDEEIRAKLTDEYVKPNMTYRDFLHMTYEMQRVGVDEGLREVATTLWGNDENGTHIMGSPQVKNEYYIAMLDKPLNPNRIALKTNAIHFANNPRYKPMTTKLISQIFNIPIGSDGYLDIPKKTENVDLQELYWNRYMKNDLPQEWWMNI